MKNKLKLFTKNILLLIATCLVVFAVAECLSRLFFKPQELFNDVIITAPKNTVVNKDNGLSYNLTTKKLLTDRYTQFFSNNPLIKKEKPPGTYRIITLGDSYTRGAGTKNIYDDSYSIQLMKLLNSGQEIKGISNFEILPICYDGLNTYQELILLQEIALAYNPDLVILQYTDNDVEYPRNEIGIMKSSAEHKNGEYFQFQKFSRMNFIIYDNIFIPALPHFDNELGWRMLKYSNFLRFVSYKLNYILREEEVPENDINSSFKSLEKISEITKEKNIPLIMFYFPPASWTENYCGTRNADFRKSLAAEAAKLQIKYFSMCDYVADINSIRGLTDAPSNNHYNKEGYGIAAEVLKNGVIDIINVGIK
ncbi:MAG TPA: hypothetical protein P5089_02680 [Candidatus Portnoybacteria bacterium]|nr:hypothetical protein [Candidatus Portnoybacteria bacterium]